MAHAHWWLCAWTTVHLILNHLTGHPAVAGWPCRAISETGGNFTYTYDDNGSITSVARDGKTPAYTYDTLGQLVRVNDRSDTRAGEDGSTWVYEYDQGGNILSKKLYPYADTSSEPLQTVSFTYGNPNWKDQLTAVADSAQRKLDSEITYDAIGNPLSDGKWTYTWQNGRQLAGMNKSSTMVSFKYNAAGLRSRKIVNGVVTKYTLHGKNIVHMTQGSNELHFFYDAQNKPAVVVYNDTPYSYVKNLQGDIVEILNSAGTAVVNYVYDAWGCPISKTGSMAGTLGTVQPFRYRGYVYDEETGMYYLRSRYYTPVHNRFVNADTIYEQNLFAYCLNEPVNKIDSNGFACVTCFNENGMPIPFSVLALGIGGGGVSALGGYIALDKVLNMEKEDWINEAKTAVVIGLCLASSGLIMNAASLLGKAFVAESVATGFGSVIGYALYGVTLTDGIILSYAVGEILYDVAGKEAKNPSEIDFVIDFASEFLPVDIPVAVDFFTTYLEESIEWDAVLPVNK